MIGWWLLLVATLGLGSPRSDSSAPGAGCPPPRELAKALRTLEGLDWATLKRGRLREIWPTQLSDWTMAPTAEKCEGSIFTRHQGHVVDNECRCCETFDFDLAPAPGGSGCTERLSNVVIVHTVGSRSKAFEVARELLSGSAAAAALLPASEQELGSAGGGSWRRSHQWWLSRDPGSGRLMNLAISRVGDDWILHLALTRLALPPP